MPLSVDKYSVWLGLVDKNSRTHADLFEFKTYLEEF
jgi:hypothetical protein